MMQHSEIVSVECEQSYGAKRQLSKKIDTYWYLSFRHAKKVYLEWI